MSVPASTTPRVISPRRRKIRLTLALLGSFGLVSAIAAGLVYWLSRPPQYAPGEASADISSELARKLPGAAPLPKFADVTSQSGLSGFRNFAGIRTSQLPEDTGPGLAWGDFDNDGDDDLFLVSAGGALNLPEAQLLPCELHENLGNGQFRKFSGFPELRAHGMGAAWADADGDGDLDLAVSAYDSLYLFRNQLSEGKSGFVRDPSFPSPKGFWTGISFGDYDNDRDLDIYVCGYVKYLENEGKEAMGSDQLGTFVPYTLNPASYTPGLNMLLRNNGDGTFTDVAESLGVTNPAGRSLGALWHDFDDDGWLDIYVANDISDNVFYHNTGGRFTDISHPAWVADYRSAMGLAAGDYDRDGDDDLHITHWVAQENALYENHFADFRSKPAGTNASPLRFTDVNEMRGLGQISLPFVGWGTEFADFDADGWVDLVVANGSTIEEPQSKPKTLKAQHAFLFWNEKGQFFHDLSEWNKSLSENHGGRGLALSDYDNDGDLDIAMAQLGEGVQLLRNDMQKGNWVELKLRNKGTKTPGFGDGAKVIVTAGGASLRRTVSSASYLSQSSRVLHFGLGAAARIDKIEVRWLAGEVEAFENLAANARYEIFEGGGTPRRIGGTASGASASDRERTIDFWKVQRAAMNALKVEKDRVKAAELFVQALAIDPRHEDSHYYLAHCLAAQGKVDAALEELLALQRINAQSHRAFQQYGNLRAIFAENTAHLDAAEAALRRARALNPEETGALLLIGEVELLKGRMRESESSLAAVCATNPRSAEAFFLRGYLSWKNGDDVLASAHLRSTRAALGKEWQPKGSTAEGDVKEKQHEDASPLRRFLEHWNGSEEPAQAYAALQRRLEARFSATPQSARN